MSSSRREASVSRFSRIVKKTVSSPPAPPLVSRDSQRDSWILLALFWLSTAAMVTVCVAAGRLVDTVWPPASAPDATLWTVLGGGGVIVVFLTKFASAHLETASKIREENRMRDRILATAFSAGPARIKHERLGKMVNLATESVEKYALYAQGFLPSIKGSFSAPLLVIAAMGVFVHPILIPLLVCSIPLIPLSIWAFRKLFSRSSNQSTRTRANLAAAYLDAIEAMTTLQLLGAAELVGEKLETLGEENRRATMRLLRSNQVIIFVVDTVFSLFAITATAVAVMYLAVSGAISPGKALTGLGLAMLLLEPIDHFGAFFYVAMAGRGAARGISAFLRSARRLDAVPEAAAATPAAAPAASGAASLLQLRDVGFRRDSKVIFKAANLRIAPGERLAIIGASGQGKTTLLHLLKGFLVPDRGSIDSGAATGSWLEKSALVSQNTWLFTGTLRENLALAAPEATAAQMWQALGLAHLDAEVRAMPAGLDTNLGENGIGLSSGQKQRLSLARALLSGRKLLLLDEVTSQVDLASEREIVKALAELGREYTLVMVTHRAGLLELADRVVRVENGEVRDA